MAGMAATRLRALQSLQTYVTALDAAFWEVEMDYRMTPYSTMVTGRGWWNNDMRDGDGEDRGCPSLWFSNRS